MRANTNPEARRRREAADRIARAVSERGAALGDPVMKEAACCGALVYVRGSERYDLDGRDHRC